MNDVASGGRVHLLTVEDQKKLRSMKLPAAQGAPWPLQQAEARVLLIVNTASRCGFTKQYAELQALHARYAEQGLQILAFPCNQFGGQEPETDDAIQAFCASQFGVRFPVLAKCAVRGQDALPLFSLLAQRAPGLLGSTAIKWNFTKFLVGRHFADVQRFAPSTSPSVLDAVIQAKLGASTAGT